MVRKGGRRSRKNSRKYRGGNGNGTPSAPSPSEYSSATSYAETVLGGTNSQYARVFDQGSGSTNTGNAIIGVQGQKAGSRRRRRRGGSFGSIVNQAIVPFGILAMQQSYRRKRRGGKRTQKH